ncbi:MAG: ATP-dependent sacrificial sulfur transferase LarE [Acidaminococcaceae bacterium]
MMTLTEKYEHLKTSVGNNKRLAVAFSGGVDSSLLLAVARDVLNQEVVALTAHSEFVPAREVVAAQELARQLGVRHYCLPVQALAVAEVAANSPERCYFCKRALFTTLRDFAHTLGFEQVVDGSNLDDLSDYRPGLQALVSLGIGSPLREAGLTKVDIRTLARQLALPNWDLPAAACLASRIPYGDLITLAKVQQVEAAELVLTQAGFQQVRVRLHGNLARLEVAAADFPRFADEQLRQQLIVALKTLGITYVTLDLEGYRTGSLNEALILPIL